MGVVLLAGGTGGAKLAAGLQDEVGAELTVIANTGDDVEIHGGHVSPDPDLVTFWLTGRIDPRGWGLDGDSFHAMEMLRELGEEVWFDLGDRDLGLCLWRARRLAAGGRLTECVEEAARRLGARARVLPMCDEPVRTRVRSAGAWHPFQDYMIRVKGRVEDVAFDGVDAAQPTPEVRAALGAASLVIIGPSNPVISIGPILAVLRDLLPRPIVAVSPLVKGEVLKGPTDEFLRWRGHPQTSEGIAQEYAGVIGGLVADERADSVPTLVTDVHMPDAAARRRLARETLAFATGLAG